MENGKSTGIERQKPLVTSERHSKVKELANIHAVVTWIVSRRSGNGVIRDCSFYKFGGNRTEKVTYIPRTRQS
jgi:hypothetical protein